MEPVEPYWTDCQHPHHQDRDARSCFTPGLNPLHYLLPAPAFTLTKQYTDGQAFSVHACYSTAVHHACWVRPLHSALCSACTAPLPHLRSQHGHIKGLNQLMLTNLQQCKMHHTHSRDLQLLPCHCTYMLSSHIQQLATPCQLGTSTAEQSCYTELLLKLQLLRLWRHTMLLQRNSQHSEPYLEYEWRFSLVCAVEHRTSAAQLGGIMRPARCSQAQPSTRHSAEACGIACLTPDALLGQ